MSSKLFITGYDSGGPDLAIIGFLKDSSGVNTYSVNASFQPNISNTKAQVTAAAEAAIIAACPIVPDSVEWVVNVFDQIESALSLSIQTSTGAVGTQVSAAQDAYVMIAGQVSTTANIAGSSGGDIIVEVAPTNSATAGDWVEKGRIGNSQALSLAIALQSVQIVKGQVVVFVPKGYYVKARSSGSGTVSYTLNTIRKILA